eukprot:364612-Chlamydomonas_euryale.AAC.22
MSKASGGEPRYVCVEQPSLNLETQAIADRAGGCSRSRYHTSTLRAFFASCPARYILRSFSDMADAFSATSSSRVCVAVEAGKRSRPWQHNIQCSYKKGPGTHHTTAGGANGVTLEHVASSIPAPSLSVLGTSVAFLARLRSTRLRPCPRVPASQPIPASSSANRLAMPQRPVIHPTPASLSASRLAFLQLSVVCSRRADSQGAAAAACPVVVCPAGQHSGCARGATCTMPVSAG